MKNLVLFLVFICATVPLVGTVIIALAQSNPGFIDGATLCADYPNPTCQSSVPANPLSLNQAFMNKMDVPGAGGPSGPLIGDGTISGLPLCNSGLIGTHTYVTNGQTNPAWLSIVLTAPTGSTVSPVFCNGTNWVYG